MREHDPEGFAETAQAAVPQGDETMREIERHFEPEPNSGCWLWHGHRNAKGYGMVARRPYRFFAHRYSWALANGPIPAGLQILHRCDTPACVNPAHLFLGTQADNLMDAFAKGRGPNQRLTPEAVREIRSSSEPSHVLEQRYRMSRSQICRIRPGWPNRGQASRRQEVQL